MKPEILLKAYVQYQSEDAFRDIVASTLDGVYASSLRMVPGAPHLAEEIALSAYSELARKAPGLSKGVVLTAWLRQCTCKMAVRILRAEERTIDWAAWKREKKARPAPPVEQPAPPGLAIRICQSIFLGAGRNRGPGFFSPRVGGATWVRPRQVAGVAVCVLVLIVWWSVPFHRPTPILMGSEGALMTPSSFAQLAGPEEGGPPSQMVNTNAGTNPNQK